MLIYDIFVDIILDYPFSWSENVSEKLFQARGVSTHHESKARYDNVLLINMKQTCIIYTVD